MMREKDMVIILASPSKKYQSGTQNYGYLLNSDHGRSSKHINEHLETILAKKTMEKNVALGLGTLLLTITDITVSRIQN